ncbi:hypothetical protein ABL78_1605 [Leptomonas seymouri]|uniref:Uncharacterized protein n=1 Tax=Leptomonas seymouri TaxID=5684 RepID=A0A0N1IAD8_LEPSE|nr:hypothetical protein ABL78_1605 [Leptomonas seymouri]|eukprot:KPI89272.1 hypothetical protein ABL78_1605 [Leptomonas seymouri]
MPTNSPFSNASTPPQRKARMPAPFASTSRVDLLYDHQPQTSFVDSTPSEKQASGYFGYSPAPQRGEENTGVQCWGCRQTQRLRTSLKRIELEYLAQIESLQQQLKRATAQRALALQERDELLTNSDAAAKQQSMIEQEAQSLRVEVMQAMQERHELRSRVHELEIFCSNSVQQQLQWKMKLLWEAEASARRDCSAAAQDEWRLLKELCDAESRAVKEALRLRAVATPSRCNVGAGTDSGGSTILCSTFISNYTSTPGPSDGGHERRLYSPRPSQHRELSTPRLTRRPSVCGDSSRSSSEGTTVVACTLLPTHAAEEAAEKVKMMEWRLEQQRSSFEMQLADERGLTADMQAEVDDLIENELMLLESVNRLTIERDASEACTELAAHHMLILTQHLWPEAQDNAAVAPAVGAAKASTHADVLDLVEESESAAWRIEMSEVMYNMQQQLYQLLSASRPPRADPEEAWEETVKDCVREEAEEIKEHLAALLEASAQARVDGDALRMEMKEHFSEVEERQCRQEAFMVASSTRLPQKEGAPTLQLESLRSELKQQRQLSERLLEVLQCASAPASAVVTVAAHPSSSTTSSTEMRPSSHNPKPGPTSRLGASLPDTVTPKRKTRHRDPLAEKSTMPQAPHAAPSKSSEFGHHNHKPLTAAGPLCEDQLSTGATVSDSTADCDPLPLRRSRIPDPRFVVAEEELFDPQCISVDASAAAEQISALLSDGSLSDADGDFPSPYEEYGEALGSA